MKKGLEIRLYPNKTQQKLIKNTFGCVRFVFNHIISLKKTIYNETGMYFNPNLKSFKEEWKFLTEVPSQAIANSYMDCMQSFNNFFNSLKGKTKQNAKFPKYHKKGKNKDSFRIACTYDKKKIGDIRIIDRNHIKIPKLGLIQFANYNDLDWSKIHIHNITIKHSACGNYYASLCCEVPDKEYVIPKYDACGFDLGIKDFCIFDSGEVINNPKYFKTAQEKLAKEQRKLSHCIRGSKNYKEKKLKIAKIHEKIKNQRKDFQHKVSRQIINENQVIVSEDLNVKGMLKNHKLSKSIADASFSSFCNMISYKAKEQGRTYIKIDTFYPSSKLCHCCGYKNTTLKLSDREWICPNCNTFLDRDNNAAINILNEGIKNLNTSTHTEHGDVKPIDTDCDNNLEWENQLAVGKSTVFSS